MKTAIRRYLLARKQRQLAKTMEHLLREADMNKAYQQAVAREMASVQVKLLSLDITARRAATMG